MFAKLETFFLEKFAGKVLARAAVSGAALLASEKVQKSLMAYGFSVSADPNALAAGVLSAAHAAYEWFKAWRLAKAADSAKAPEAPKA